MSGANRRRSTSEGERDHLSSTLNLPEHTSNSRIPSFNPERCVSTPHINTTGFIDDTYRDHRGARLEPRARTRSRGGSSSLDNKLKSDFFKLKNEILKWGNFVSNSAQTVDDVERRHIAFRAEITRKIGEVLSVRGDANLANEYEGLRDRLNTIRRTARELASARADPDPFYLHDDPLIYPATSIPQNPISTRSINHDGVFLDEPRANNGSVIRDVSSQGSNPKLSNTGMPCGSGSMRLDLDHGSLSQFPDDPNLFKPGMPRDSESMRADPDPGSLNNQSRARVEHDVISTNSWMLSMKTRQITTEERLDSAIQLIMELQSAQNSFQRIEGDLDILKSNQREVWRRLKVDERRLEGLGKEMASLGDKLDDKVEMIREWFIDLTAKTTSEVPKEIVDSLLEVIRDTSPGVIMEGLRTEVEEIRGSVIQTQRSTEGLKSTVADLSVQMLDMSQSVHAVDPSSSSRGRDMDESSNQEREIVRKGIERMEKQLRQVLRFDLSKIGNDISLIKKLKTVDVPTVHTAVSSIQKSLQKYVKFAGMSLDYCTTMDELLDMGENWCLSVEELYTKAEVHSINTSKGDTADVGIFSDNAKVTVYEFLEAAEIAYLGWGNSMQKANRLYNHHLSEEIKSKLINMSDSYADMKKWLITNYGGVSRIVSDIVRDLTRRPKPGSNNSTALFTFYAHVSGALQRLERLTKVNGINREDLESCLYSRATLSTLALVLTNQTHADWITEMTRAGLDYKNPVGLEAYKIFKNICIIERNKGEGSRDLEKPTSEPRIRSPKINKSRSAHKVKEDIEEMLEDAKEIGVFATSFHNIKWYQPGLKFPCPVKNHQHEMNTCGEFFSFNPAERWSKMEKGKICYSCLKPKDQCSTKKCSFESKIPETLKCQGCAPWAQANRLAPLSILFCRRREHANLRASFPDMKNDLEKYLGKLGTTVVDSSIKFAANYTFQVFSMDPGANALGWSQREFIDKPAPTIDSETGRNLQVPSDLIIPEVSEHSCYLMQTVKIGSTEALVFFDRGANIHIIDGSLAEKEGLQRVSNTPTSLTVVGGNKIRSNHGTFRFNLGPGDRGEFHEIVCVGMDDVTAGFGSYDLSDICQEYRDQAIDAGRDVILPPRVGGSRVHLLLGIKNTKLDPKLVKLLPSGIAVYLSPFKDIYGSRLIFAGPHKSFTKSDNGNRTEMSNAVFLIRDLIYEGLEEECETRCYSIMVNKRLGLTVNPYPINEEDVIESAGRIPCQFEESLDDHELLIDLLEESGCGRHGFNSAVENFKKIVVNKGDSRSQVSYEGKSRDLLVEQDAPRSPDAWIEDENNCSKPEMNYEGKSRDFLVEQRAPTSSDALINVANVGLEDVLAVKDCRCGVKPSGNQTVMRLADCLIPEYVGPDLHINDGIPENESRSNLYGIHKAHVPIAKFRNALDDEESEDRVGFRCAECARCLTCKTSSRKTAVSLREAREQQFIEESVKIDLEKKRVIVNYPFLKDPVEYLSSVHNNQNNYNQALKVYKTQCKKSEMVKEGMRKVHKDLVEKGFMVKLRDIDPVKRKLVESAPFQHYNPWRLVMKMDSVTTPIRMVVDPTMSKLNEILAKGENKLGSIFSIMIRCRCTEYVWSSDISKLYNQLVMDDPSLPYSLFLYGEELSQDKDPEVWVMVRAWYGIVSTGGQAGFALDRLTELLAEKFPDAYKTLRNNRYVDDIISGANSRTLRDIQIKAVEEVLKRGGFSLKFIVKSGEKPSEKASPDGDSMKLLGYKWDSERDELSPGLGELNLNKKNRGERKPNLEPVRNIDDAEKLLSSVKLTRSLIIGKISEFFDPCGFFEPVKLQMKLLTGSLKGKGWDEVLPEQDQILWREILKGYVKLPKIIIPRFCLPGTMVSSSKIRLICLADAAEFAGGAAIYAGRELGTGGWSCSLLAAKSKMMKETIPRNELSAILLCAELAFMVKSALGSEIGEVIFVTDSTIALSWCSNQSIKLRLFVYNRVMTILRLFEWVTESKENPLWHIDGTLNLADLLTKKHEIEVSTVSQGSDWIEGIEWMRKPKKEMPLTSYEDLKLETSVEEVVKAECFSESFMEKFSGDIKPEIDDGSPAIGDDDSDETGGLGALAANAGKGVAELLVDPVFEGWRRALRIIGYMQGWRTKHYHRKHTKVDKDCNLCKLGDHRWDSRNENKKAEDYLFRWESERVRRTLRPLELRRFVERDGIIYDQGRLTPEFQFKTQDLDQVGYLDKQEIVGEIPVVLPDSPVLYAYLMFLHTRGRAHASLESTVKEVFKKMKVVKGLRRLIKKIIQDCTKCRLMEKKTLELRLSAHPEARTILAPCFHSCMMDICYGFKGQSFKRSRTVIKIYGLVIVCLMSGATNIMALEGIETQDVVAALERHSCRYGVPGFVYVDNGTQLKALQHARFHIRDLESQVQDDFGIKIIVSNAKAHSERGRVERRIRVLRETMEKLGVDTTVPMTALQWDTLFSRISNSIDNLPIARGDTSNGTSLGYEIITPNRLKLGRNNYRSLEGNGFDLEMSSNFTQILDRNRSIYQQWYQFFIHNVHLLNLRPNKWLKSSRLPLINDLVVFVYNDSNHAKEPINWKLGKIVKIVGNKVSVSYSVRTTGIEQTLERSLRDISIIYSVGEFLINTQDHFDECTKLYGVQEE